MNMKKVCVLLLTCFLFGCGQDEIDSVANVPDEVNYFKLLEDELPPSIQTLLENVSFEEGVLGCSMDRETAEANGIAGDEYDSFLRSIQIENQKIKEYLDAGVVVVYNGQPFTYNEELYQYVLPVEEAKSRFQYDMGTLIKTLSFEYREDNIGMTQNVKFTGPSRISFSRLSGNGAFFLTERLKGFTTYLLSGSVAFTYGFGDQTNWDWKIEYETPKNSSAILEIFGHARIHEATEDATPRPTMELPSFVQVEDLGRTSGQGRLKLLVYDERGNRYQFKMYKRLGDDYSEFYYSPPVKGDANPAPLYMTYPIQTTFWLVGWVKNSQNLWQYIGEKEFYSQYDTK